MRVVLPPIEQTPAMNIRLKRVYESAETDDGCRVLVDRLWPRGIKREAAHIDLWLKEIAPSAALRREYGHRPDRWDDFQREYARELQANTAVGQLRRLAETQQAVTLLFAARNTEQNNAVALRAFLQSNAFHGRPRGAHVERTKK